MTLPENAMVPPAPEYAVVTSAMVDGVDVGAVAAAVQGCPGVSALVGGRFGDVVSYLPGRKIAGVAVRDGRVKVQVRAGWGVPAADLAVLITAVLAPLTGDRPVDVVIADIDDPPVAPPMTTPGGAGQPWAAAGLPPV